MSKDVQDYLEKGMYGTPQLKPDEQRKYLGTYRERVVFVLTAEELTNQHYDLFATEQFKAYPDGTVLLNANVTGPVQNHVMQLAQKNNRPFKLVDSSEATPLGDTIALVYTVGYAIDREHISLSPTPTRPLTKETQPTEKTPEKTGFFKKLFSKG